jgi:hypothetical protein
VLACRDDAIAPDAVDVRLPLQSPIASLFLEPVASPTLGPLLFEELISVLPNQGEEDPTEVTLWEPGELTGPVVVEVTSAVAPGTSGAIPIQEVLNHGLVVWWDTASIIFSIGPARTEGPPVDTTAQGRLVSLEFYSIDSLGAQTVDTTFVPGSSPTVHFAFAAAAESGFGLRWAAQGFTQGFGADPTDPVCIDVHCAPLPPIGGRLGRTISGTLEVRVYEAGEEQEVTLEVTADTTELHPWIRFFQPLGTPAPFVQSGRAGDATSIQVSVGVDGAPAPNREVLVRAELLPSGGHAHLPAPMDIGVAHLADLPGSQLAGDGKPVAGMFAHEGDTTTSVSAETNESGEISLEFVAGFVAGHIEVIVLVPNGGAPLIDTLRLTVQVPGLVALDTNPEISANALLIGPTAHHPAGSWSATADFATTMQALVVGQRKSLGGQNYYLQLNDASLPLGGAFTVTPPATAIGTRVEQPGQGHRSHALGIEEDLSWCYALDAGHAGPGDRISGTDCGDQGTLPVDPALVEQYGFLVLVERGAEPHYHLRLED